MTNRHTSEERLALRAKTLAYWLLITLSALVAIILLYLDNESSFALKASSVGASLLGAALFGVFIALLLDRESDTHLEASLRALFHEQEVALLERIQAASHLHVPTAEYPPTESFDPIFMLDLMRDLCGSSRFWFRGSTGKWIAPYLSYCERTPGDVQALILDPRDETAIRQRAADRSRTAKNANRSIDELADELRREIALAIVAIFDVRHQCDVVKIFLSGARSTTTGIDLTDDAVYVGLHVTGPGHAARNPTSYRYARGSLAYENHRVELSRQFKLAGSVIVFDTSSTDDDLTDALAMIGVNDVSKSFLGAARSEAAVFAQQFHANMDGAVR